MIVYAAQKCDCIHESGYSTLSLHTTKLGAYKACREWWLKLWNDWNTRVSGDGIHGGYNSKQRREDFRVALDNKRWEIRPFELQDYPIHQEGLTVTTPNNVVQSFPISFSSSKETK